MADDNTEKVSTGCCGRKKGEKPKTKEPRDTKITQQTLPACKPVYERQWVLLIFLLVTIVFIPVGVVCLVYGLKAVEISQQYDSCWTNSSLTNNEERQNYLWQNSQNPAALGCTVNIRITDEMASPIYVYYEIHGMYQNHRRYVRSHVDQQLADTGKWQGVVNDEKQSQNCVPIVYYGGNDSQLINPCGLVAWTFFNDSYTFALQSDTNRSVVVPLPVSDQGIAFSSDVEHRFANYTPQYYNFEMNQNRGGGTFNTTLKQNERFMVWMRLSHMARFKKLWGIIENQTLYPGDIVSVSITNQYNTFSFDGKKYIVLSTTTWLGGHSVFLGAAYLATGGLSLVFAIIFLIITMVKPRGFGDTSSLSKQPVTTGDA